MDSRRAREWSELYRSNFTDPDLPDPDAAAPKEKWIRANERIQRVDAEVRAALNDVAIPEGLKGRVLEQFAPPRVERFGGGRSAIRWAAVFGVVCTLALMVLWSAHRWNKRTWDPDLVCQEAIRLYRRLNDQRVAYPGKVARDFPFRFSNKDCIGVHQPEFLGVVANAYEFRKANRRVLVIALPRSRFAKGDLGGPLSYLDTAGLTVQFFEDDKEWVYVAVCERPRDLILFTAGNSLTAR